MSPTLPRPGRLIANPQLHEIFEVTARDHPDRTAVDAPPTAEHAARISLSYAEVWDAAGGLAAAIAASRANAQGGALPSDVLPADVLLADVLLADVLLADALPAEVLPAEVLPADARVAILLPRSSPALYVAQLAVLRAGAAFLCLDPRFPDAQFRAVLEDARPLVILTDRLGRGRLEALETALPPLIELSEVPRAADADAPSGAAWTLVASPRDGAAWTLVASARAAATSQSAASPKTAATSQSAASHRPAASSKSAAISPLDAPAKEPGASSGLASADFEDPRGMEGERDRDRDLAYLIYTSGTTGRPKGVMLEHRGIVELVESDRAHFGLGPEDRVAQLSSPAYDSSIEESWLAFAVGATLVLLDDETLRLGPDLPAWLRAEGITVLCPPPTLLRSMACEDPAAELPGLRLLYVGGEALPADLADRWAPGRRMVNGYGPTECTVTVLRAEVAAGRSVRIGFPLGRNRAWVLDAELQPLPSGQVGELCIAGPALARGYLGQKELSERRFPEHPELGRLYRTGDLVRFDPEGGFEYLGRIDDQVKLRGYRIELGAVEAALAALPGLRAAACRLQGAGARQILAAHLVAEEPGRPPEIAAILEGLRAILPDYMVPARLAFIDHLPTSLGGKLDRRALPEIATPATGLSAHAFSGNAQAGSSVPADVDLDHALPATPASAISAIPAPEALLMGILAAFAEALELEAAPDPKADFFLDLGGDSLAAVAAVLALRRDAASAPVTVRELYAARTASALAARLREGSQGLVASSSAPEAATSERTRTDRYARATAGSASTTASTTASSTASTTAASTAAAPAAESRLGADLATVAASLPSDAAVAAFTLLQALWLGLGLVFSSILLWWVAVVLLPALLRSFGLTVVLLATPFAWLFIRLLAIPLSVATTAGLARLLIGRYQPGVIPLWSMLHLRHWCILQSARAIPWDILAGTPFGPLALRALGARVGRGVHLHRGVEWGAGGWNLIQIGAGATLGRDAAPLAVELAAGQLHFGRIEIGTGASLGTRSGMSPGARIGPGARLGSLSWLPGGALLPAGERWDGSPAEPAGWDDAEGSALEFPHSSKELDLGGAGPEFAGPELAEPAFARPASARPASAEPDIAAREAWASGSALLLARAAAGLPANIALAMVSLLALSIAAPGEARPVLSWLASPALSPGLVIGSFALSAIALALRLIFQGLMVRGLSAGIAAGSHPLSSPTALRSQLAGDLVEAAGRWLSGSMLWPAWLRLAGMRIGRRCEISTIMECLPRLVEMDEECFFADGVYLAAPRLHAGRMQLGRTRIGRRTFLGNHSLLPGGHAWPAGLFLGVATRADAAIASDDSVDPGGGWFGHPAMALPAREVLEIDRRLTYEPSAGLWLTRAFWESLRLALPALPWILGLLWFGLVARAEERLRPATFFLLALPALTFFCLALACLAALALKWLLLGRVKPGQHAFWSSWCGRWDLVYMAWGVWAQGILGALEGSLMLNAMLRASGMRIGRRVALGQGFAQVVDPDMLHFEEGASVACQFQAHSFEDRVLKIDRLRIGKGASVGQHTVVFYGAEVGAGARVAPHGVVMKRDQVEAGWYYAGSPSQPVARVAERSD